MGRAGPLIDERDMNTESNNSEQNQQLGDIPESDVAAQSAAASIGEVELKLQIGGLQEQLLRARAETENIRRRADEEIAKARKFALESFAESLLPVKDSLEAAIANLAPAAAADGGVSAPWLEGVHATLRQLSAALERNKVVEINPGQGQKFDPHLHQAISVVSASADSSQEANTVVAVLQKGYAMAERVLRPALVTVTAPR